MSLLSRDRCARWQKPAAEGPTSDPYSVVDDGFVPEGFLIYKRRRTGSFRLHGMSWGAMHSFFVLFLGFWLGYVIRSMFNI